MNFTQPDDAIPHTPKKEIFSKNLNKEQLAYELMSDLCAYENHYNLLQNKYKSLAMTWVIATFIGVGYLLAGYETGVSLNIFLGIMFLCCISSIGIFLLWHLDGGLYHKFLESIFSEALKLEKNHPALGVSHQNIIKLHYLEHDPHILHGMFYSLFIVFLLTISGFCLSIYLYEISKLYFTVVLFFLFLGWIVFIMLHRKTFLFHHYAKGSEYLSE